MLCGRMDRLRRAPSDESHLARDPHTDDVSCMSGEVRCWWCFRLAARNSRSGYRRLLLDSRRIGSPCGLRSSRLAQVGAQGVRSVTVDSNLRTLKSLLKQWVDRDSTRLPIDAQRLAADRIHVNRRTCGESRVTMDSTLRTLKSLLKQWVDRDSTRLPIDAQRLAADRIHVNRRTCGESRVTMDSTLRTLKSLLKQWVDRDSNPGPTD